DNALAPVGASPGQRAAIPSNTTKPAGGGLQNMIAACVRSALAGLEALVHLVDDVDPPATADELVRAVASHQRRQRVADLHLSYPQSNKRGACAPGNVGAYIWKLPPPVNASPALLLQHPDAFP